MKTQSKVKRFPFVCVGGSAVELDAYIRFLHNLPANFGAAIVIVNYLRSVATLLHQTLSNHTKMPVELITEKLDIKLNHVFTIPEKRNLHVLTRYNYCSETRNSCSAGYA